MGMEIPAYMTDLGTTGIFLFFLWRVAKVVYNELFETSNGAIRQWLRMQQMHQTWMQKIASDAAESAKRIAKALESKPNFRENAFEQSQSAHNED